MAGDQPPSEKDADIGTGWLEGRVAIEALRQDGGPAAVLARAILVLAEVQWMTIRELEGRVKTLEGHRSQQDEGR